MQKQRLWVIFCAIITSAAGSVVPGRRVPATPHPRLQLGRSGQGELISGRLPTLPSLILWVWERPEDLRSIPPGRVAVSFLAVTVTLSGAGVTVRPRLQALRVAPGTPLMACARIEADRKQTPSLTSRQSSAAAAAIARLGDLPGVSGVQVDFDATPSERAFYAQVLRQVRRALPPAMRLSITALASWCVADPWISALPVDEAVPMLFQMGPDGHDVRTRLEAGQDFSLAVCRGSLGISTDEPIRALPPGRRLYVFNPDGWSGDAVSALLASVRP